MTLSNPQTGTPKFAVDLLNPQKHLDSRLTFSRTGNATMYDATGKLVWAPANMLTYSEDFSKARWLFFTSGGGTATVSADKKSVTFDVPIGGRAFINTNEACIVGQSYTISAAITINSGSISDVNAGISTFSGASLLGGRAYVKSVATGTSANMRFGLGVNTGASSAANITVYFPQLEPTSYNSPQPYIPTTSAAYYGPRFDHDPSTLALRGLLMEDSRQNALFPSEGLSAWSTGGTGVPVRTENHAGSPDGLNKFTFWKRERLGVPQYSSNTIAKPSAASYPYVFTMYCKKAAVGDYIAIRIQGSYPNRVDAVFNLATGTAGSRTNGGSGFSGTESSIKDIGNGVYRITLSTATTDTGANIFVAFSFNSTGSNQVDTNTDTALSEGYVYGAKLEQADFATSYIPTYGATATRAADSLYTTNIPWFNATQGSFALTYVPIGDVETGTARPVNFSNGTTAEAIGFYGQVKTNALVVNIQIGGTGYNSDALGQIKDNENTIAISYLSGKNNASRGGILATGASYLTSSLPTGINRLDIMNTTAGNRSVTGWIKSFRYWNYALSSAQLQAVTKV